MKSRLEGLDQAQQRRPALAIPIATVKKFGEDKSSNLASMMAFWAFFSIFPLLLAGITVLSWVVPEQDRVRVLGQVAGYFPLLDVSTIGALSGSVAALLVGIGAALWSGSTVVRVTQEAFNAVWEVPRVERPKLVEQLKRSVLAMATIGVGLLASTFAIGFINGDNPAIDLGPASLLLGYAAAIAVDIGLFIVAFRLLTDRQITTRDVLPGAVFAGVAFWVLQSVSTIIITRHLSSAQATYGNFATVITILWWFYLQSQLTLLGAQVNVVLKRHYWPRGLVNAPETEADYRVLEDYAKERTHVEGEHVQAHIPGDDRPSGPSGGPGGRSTGPDAAGRQGGGGVAPAATGAAATGIAQEPGEASLAELLNALSEQTQRLVRDEIKLAGLELKGKGKAAGKGIGLLGAAGVVACYGAGALLAGVIMVVGLALGAWGAALITAAVLAGTGVMLAVAGKKQVTQVGSLLPEQAIDELGSDITVVKERIQR